MKFKLFLIFICYCHVVNSQVFTEVSGTSFIEWANATVEFADVDGDNDQDLMILGYSFDQKEGKMYLNDGLGKFTLIPETPFVGRFSATIDFADVDGDGDLDLLTTGYIPGSEYQTILYSNNGSGLFTDLETKLHDVDLGSTAFGDIDGDGDQDLIISGQEDSGDRKTSLYVNDGSGIFTEVIDAPFVNVSSGDIGFADIDGDSDLDVLITGRNNSGQHAELYENDGHGNFIELIQEDIHPSSNGNVSFFDMDNDGDMDLISTGSFEGVLMTQLYINNGLGSFSEDNNSNFIHSGVGGFSIADINGDNFLDILFTGQTSLQNPITPSTNLYINNGFGGFSEVPDMPFVHVNGDVAISDIDGDDDYDVIIVGFNDTIGVTKLYKNDMMTNTTSQFGHLLNKEITIHPNLIPFGHSINISLFSSNYSSVNISLYDFLGRRLRNFDQQLSSGINKIVLNTTGIEKGNFFIKFDDGRNSQIEKIQIY